MIFQAHINVTLKPSVNDPQGKTVETALLQLGFTGVESVRIGKSIEMQIDSSSLDDARQAVMQMCEKLLHNPVIETYGFEVGPAKVGAAAG